MDYVPITTPPHSFHVSSALSNNLVHTLVDKTKLGEVG